MRLTALVESLDHVCCRYRLAAFRPYLEQAGHSLELIRWPRAWCSRLALEWNGADADAVILQRKLLPTWQLYLLRRAARVLVYDFDDAVFLRDSYSAKGLHSARRLQRFAAMMDTADIVVAGNSFLADQAARWTPSNRIHVIPTCVNPNDYPLARHLQDGTGVELVWVGSSSTLRGLEAIRPLLETLGQHWPGLRLRLVCDRFLALQNLRVMACPWSQASEAADIAAADIGISWLPEDSWSRGKCGLKVLQYMAAGLPVVANPVGVQGDLVRHGETGFLAQTAGEWLEAIGRLARHPDLRRQMGQAGRQRVEAEFGVGVGAASWLGLLAGLRRRKAA